MRLSFMETYFLYGTALRAEGLAYGAVGAAVKMVQWAEIHHGIGVAYFERRRKEPRACYPLAMRLLETGDTAVSVDGGGQTSLLVGPAVLDLVTAAASRSAVVLARVVDVSDLGWLGQLADRAAARGLACFLSFEAAANGVDATDLDALYSRGRSIVVLPGSPAPLWVEMPVVPASHLSLMTGEPPDDPLALARDALIPADGGVPGFALACVGLDAETARELSAAVRNVAEQAQACIWEPEALAALRRRAFEEGMEVDDAEWRSLARHGLTTVVPSSEVSRGQAGAESGSR